MAPFLSMLRLEVSKLSQELQQAPFTSHHVFHVFFLTTNFSFLQIHTFLQVFNEKESPSAVLKSYFPFKWFENRYISADSHLCVCEQEVLLDKSSAFSTPLPYASHRRTDVPLFPSSPNHFSFPLPMLSCTKQYDVLQIILEYIGLWVPWR